MVDETLLSRPTPAEQRMRVFISFAEGGEEFADYLGYVLALRGFEPSSSPAPRFRRRVIAKTEASIFVLTAAAAASKRVLGELNETSLQSKPALVLIPGALGDDVAIPEAFAAHPQLHSWRNPDIAGSSLVNGLLALENALDAIRLTPRAAPSAETPAHAATELAEAAIIAAPAAKPEIAVPQAEPAEQGAETFSIEALTSAFVESVPDPFVIPEHEQIEPAVTPETIAAELIAEPLLASAPSLEAQLLGPAAGPQPASEFILETLEPQDEGNSAQNPALSPVFTVKLEPTYDVLDLTTLAEEAPLLAPRLAPPVAPLAFPRLVSSQPASRVQPPRAQVKPAPIAPLSKGNARRRSVAHLAIVTASLMCAAANAPWLMSFISTARAAAAEEKHRNPAAAVLKPSVTIRNSEPEAPAAAIAPAPIAKPTEPEIVEPEAVEPASAAIVPQAEPASAEEAAHAPMLTDAEHAEQLDHADWLEARKIGNLAAFRTYIEKHADGVHYAEAMERARRRIAELSTQPPSSLVYLTGPAAFRGLPTRDIDGIRAGADGQDVYPIDRILTRREGEWLVFERGGAWPFLFVNTDEVEKTPKELPVKELAPKELAKAE